MKKLNSLINLINLFFIISFYLFSFSRISYASTEQESYKEELSYGQKDHFFVKKNISKGLSEVVQTRQRQPWRQPTWSQRVNYFISQLKKGDKSIFLYTTYALLDGYGNPYTHTSVQGYPTHEGSHSSYGVMWTLEREATRKNITVREVLTQGSEKIRKNVIQATLKGLLNKDPRVRLVAINLLRRLGPDVMMYKAVKNALILETSTTEWSKLRPKDIDIPSIESPRLGYEAMASKGGSTYSLKDRFYGYHGEMTKAQYLDANGKGLYLTEGLYRKGERNDYKVDFYRFDHLRHAYTVRKVWSKAPLLRYGADQKVSGYEMVYGFKEKEVMPKYIYAYLDYRHPETGQIKDTIYYAYHSVWEELQKLYLFINRALWVSKIKAGQYDILAKLSKDSFRSLADQIDGESLENVPMKSPNFKIFSEDEIQSVILGLLNNRVISTREECLMFLKRIYAARSLSPQVRKEIKTAVRSARRRALVTDIERGRNLQSELLLFRKPALMVEVESGKSEGSKVAASMAKADEITLIEEKVKTPS